MISKTLAGYDAVGWMLRSLFEAAQLTSEEVKGKVGEMEKVLLKIKSEAFLKRVCGILGKKVREVVGSGKDRDRVRVREVLSYLDWRCTELEVKSIAEVLMVDPTCVSRGVARVEARVLG